MPRDAACMTDLWYVVCDLRYRSTVRTVSTGQKIESSEGGFAVARGKDFHVRSMAELTLAARTHARTRLAYGGRETRGNFLIHARHSGLAHVNPYAVVFLPALVQTVWTSGPCQARGCACGPRRRRRPPAPGGGRACGVCLAFKLSVVKVINNRTGSGVVHCH